MTDRIYIIAEVGVNHNGSLKMAKQLIDVAADAGADAVKFQTFKAKKLAGKNSQKAEYQKDTTGKDESQLEMLKKLELSEEDHKVLIHYCQKNGIEFLSTPFDASSLNLLTNRFGLEMIKIPSGEITNAPFLLVISHAAKKVILSTGMSSLAEVELALSVLAFGFITSDSVTPKRREFEQAFASSTGQQALRKRVTLLHCTTEYPAPFEEVNLRAMDTLSASFGLPVGYSDHTTGIHISLAAVARGAQVIEKHFTLDRSLPGPDHKASLEPNELKQLVSQIRNISLSLGDGVKRPTLSEWKNRDIARKSLVAAKNLQKGQVFAEENLTSKRPGNGISPMLYWEQIGKQAQRNYETDELID
jgi:N-acetylneuraminate synthase